MSFRKFIGIPYLHQGRDFKGIDCYGLIVLVYKENLDIELPDPTLYEFGTDACNYMPAFYTNGEYEGFSGYYKLWEPVDRINLQKYDIVLLNTYSGIEAPTHSGLYVGDGLLIHSMSGLPVTIHRMDRWEDAIHSTYRYKERELNG